MDDVMPCCVHCGRGAEMGNPLKLFLFGWVHWKGCDG